MVARDDSRELLVETIEAIKMRKHSADKCYNDFVSTENI
jgi:hypothetical protein